MWSISISDPVLLQKITEETFTGIVVVQDGILTYCNQRAANLVGFPGTEALLGRRVFDFIPIELHEEIQIKLQQFLDESHAPLRWEGPIHKINGHEIWVDVWVTKIEISGRKAVLANLSDVTERRDAEDKLRLSEEKYRDLVELASDGICIVQDMKICYANPRLAQILGYNMDEFIGKSFQDFIHPFEKSRITDIYARYFSGSSFLGIIPTQAIHKSGDTVDIELNAARVEHNSKPAALVTVRDVTDRRLAEATLAERERQLYTLMSNLPGMAYRCRNDQQWTMEFVSEGCFDLTELSPAQLVGNNKFTYADLIHTEDRAKVWNAVQKSLDDHDSFAIRYRLVTLSGKVKWVWEQGQGVFDKSGNLLFLEGFILDITDQKIAEDLERKATAELAILFQSATRFVELTPDDDIHRFIANQLGVLVDSIFIAVNEYDERKDALICKAFVGPGGVLGKAINILGGSPIGRSFPIDDDYARMEIRSGRLATVLGGLHDLTFKQVPKSICEATEKFLGIGTMYSIGFVWNNRLYGNATIATKRGSSCEKRLIETFASQASLALQRVHAYEEKKQLEEQLHQAQKMESIGRLAGGVAHDFNNLLTGITGNLELALMELDPQDPLYTTLTEVNKAARSAASLTRQLLAFSRKQVIEPRVVNLNTIIENLTKMLKRLIGEHIILSCELDSEVGNVRVDPGQLEQILVNLAVNARDAMEDGGRLSIRTLNTTFPVPNNRNVSYMAAPAVSLVVADTGCGMSEEVKSHLFEPFFTTKPTGKGTGLGLATIYGAVKQNGGEIEVESEPGIGSIFRIYLPLVNEEAEHLPQTVRELPLGSEKILLVEDETIVRDLAAKILKRLGYQVLTFSNGGEALLHIEKSKEKFDLLLTDVVMPGLNGRDLAKAVTRKQPDMKVLFTSGFAEDVITKEGIIEKDLPFIGKPYSPQSLAIKVREILGKPKTSKLQK